MMIFEPFYRFYHWFLDQPPTSTARMFEGDEAGGTAGSTSTRQNTFYYTGPSGALKHDIYSLHTEI